MLDHSSSELPEDATPRAAESLTNRPRGGEPALRRAGSWCGWPFFVRILLWSTRNNRAGENAFGTTNSGALKEPTTGERQVLANVSVRIWDGPVRIVHWAITLLIPLAWWAVETQHMAWHYRLGYTLLGLLVFRLIWGFAGSSTARFAAFVRSPRRVIEYLRGNAAQVQGHNPLGALSIIAMLGVLVFQIGLGLFAASGDGRKAGPFADLVTPGATQAAAALHQANFYALLALIGLHIGAVLFYLLVRHDNLIAPMLTGRRSAPAGTAPVATAPAARLFVAAAIAVAVTIWLLEGT